MLKKLHQLLKQVLDNSGLENNYSEDEQKKLAVYGILYEAARSDNMVAQEEEEKIREIMERYFKIDDSEYFRIKKIAEHLHLNSTDMFQVSRDIRSHLSREERLVLLDELWEVAFADGILDPYETMIIRRLAGLLGLENSELIESKMKVAMKIKD